MRSLASASAQPGCVVQQLVAVEMEVADQRTCARPAGRGVRGCAATAAAASSLLTVRRTSSEPARARDCDLLDGALDVGRIGVGHRLDDDGRAAAHRDLADLDGERFSACLHAGILLDGRAGGIMRSHGTRSSMADAWFIPPVRDRCAPIAAVRCGNASAPRARPARCEPAAVRVGRETQGRAGKGVTTITGLPLSASRSRGARDPTEEALRFGRHGARRRHRDPGRSPRHHRRGARQARLAGQKIGRLTRGLPGDGPAAPRSAAWYDAASRQEPCGESPPFDEGRRRRNRPETLRHTNCGLSRSLESGRIDGATHRRGAALSRRAISQVLRTEGRTHVGAGVSVVVRSEVAMGLKTPLYDTHVRRAPRSSTSAAGTCRCPTARNSRSTTRCAATAGMFDVSHMCVVDLTGARVREFLRHAARERRREADTLRARRSIPACCCRTAASSTI